MPKNFAEYKRKIDEYLRRYLQENEYSLKNINRWGSDITSRLQNFVADGKTIRGGLVLLAAEAYGKKVDDDTLKAASALELIHSGLLIHDDIIDQDRTRRGNKTLYVQYEDIARELNIEQQVPFGAGMATCVGDLTFFLAMGMVSTIQDAPVASRLVHTLSQEYTSVCLAQMQDVTFGFSTIIPSEEEVLSVYRYKTARYTFSLPLMTGAMLSHLPEKEIQLLEKLGETVGLLFQMHDDRLNLFGLSKETGKPVGSDIREGKKTLAYLFLYKRATAEERQKLDELFGNTHHADDTSTYVYALLTKYDVEKEIAERLRILTTEAYAHLEKLTISPDYRDLLRDIINYTITRDK